LFTRASAVLDKGVARFMERRMRAPTQAPDDARARLLEVSKAYSAGTLAIPSPFFTTPDVPRMELDTQGDGPLGTYVVDLTWKSDYEPYLDIARPMHAQLPENHTAHARWWTSGKGRPTIVILHGWGAGPHWMTARHFDVPYWLRHGYDVAAYVLPHHAMRTKGMSGTLFPSTNPLRTNEGFGQAIYELRALAQFLRARGTSALGALGMSLGGYTAALWASVAGPQEVGGLEFAVALVPAVSFAQLFWHHGEHSDQRIRAARAGVSEELLSETFAVHAPLSRPVRLPAERLAVIAGRGDRICPPEQAQQLAKHWGVEIQWFDGGHLTQIGRAEQFRNVRRQLGALGFAGREMRL
jgi:pimeloyl-ACP methyl ester carboxylesterase